MTNKKCFINAEKFCCYVCDFKCSKISNYNTHLTTLKHKKLINTNYKNAENAEDAELKIYKCNCGKEYKHHSSLCNHKKKCLYKEDKQKIIRNDDTLDYKTMFIKIMRENEKLQDLLVQQQKQSHEQFKQMSELIPQIGNNNNNTNNVKQKFNINVFLNEKCKDAISIDQFIDTIEVSMKNLLTTRDKGLGEGLSSIIIDNMNKLSLYERPMHCTDKKRETMYIKNQEWAKDDKLEQVDQLLKRVENKQLKNIKQWTDANPNFMESEKLQEEYIKLIKGCTSSIDECRGKTIKKVCDKVYIEKE